MSYFYDIPPGHTVCSSLHTVFTHYSTPWTSTQAHITGSINKNNSSAVDLTINNVSFFKMCKEIPHLMDPENSVEYGLLRRKDIDLIFAKCAPLGGRRMNFSHFLEALELIALKIYPKDDPTNAFTKLLVGYIYGAFDHAPITPSAEVYEKIVNELSPSENTNSSYICDMNNQPGAL